jgi:DNA-3-methyladenine glycosylase I
LSTYSYTGKPDEAIRENVLQIIETMVQNKVEGFYGKKGWDPFDPSFLTRHQLDKPLKLENDQFWEQCFAVIFYAGFRAQTVEHKYAALCQRFGDYNRVAEFTEKDVRQMLKDRAIIRHEAKIRAIVQNAKAFLDLLGRYGSARDYIAHFSVPQAPANEDDLARLEQLKCDLRQRFEYFGPATTDHFLMLIGFQVLKADIVIRRLLYRLEITEEMLTPSKEDEKIAMRISLHIAQLIGIPIGSLDTVLHWFGRREGAEICTDKPKCNLCLVKPKCVRV